MSVDAVVLYAAVAASAAVVALVAMTSERRCVIGRWLLWLGACAPFLISGPQTLGQVDQAELGGISALRGGVPMVAFAIGVALTRPARRHWGVVEWGLAVFLGTAVLSTIWSVEPTSTLLRSLMIVFPYLCIGAVVRTYDDFESAIRGLGLFVHLLILSTLLGLALAPNLTFVMAGEVRRLQALLGAGPNTMALVIGVGILMLMTSTGPKYLNREPVRTALIFVYAGMLLATRTRTSLLIFAVLACAAVVWMWRRRPLSTMLLGTLGAVSLTFIAYNTNTVRAYIERQQTLDGLSTLTGRTEGWVRALDLWREQPWLGFGYYSGHRIALPQEAGSWLARSNLDNVWIETLLGTGVVGLFGLALFVIAGWARIERSRALLEQDQLLFMRLTTVSIVLISFVNPTIQTNVPAMVIGGFVLLLVPSRARTTYHQASGRKPEYILGRS